MGNGKPGFKVLTNFMCTEILGAYPISAYPQTNIGAKPFECFSDMASGQLIEQPRGRYARHRYNDNWSIVWQDSGESCADLSQIGAINDPKVHEDTIQASHIIQCVKRLQSKDSGVYRRTPCPGGFNHLRRLVDCGYLTARPYKPFGVDSHATSNVENMAMDWEYAMGVIPYRLSHGHCHRILIPDGVVRQRLLVEGLLQVDWVGAAHAVPLQEGYRGIVCLASDESTCSLGCEWLSGRPGKVFYRKVTPGSLL
jgi:hypothetical protein